MVKLVWTELSTEDLKDIFDYVAKDSTRYAFIIVNTDLSASLGIDGCYGQATPKSYITHIRLFLYL